MFPYFFDRFNLEEKIVFTHRKVLQYFFAYLKLRPCLNIKFPTDFSKRSAHHCSSESFMNMNELTFIILMWDGNYIIPSIDATENPKCSGSAVLSFQLDLLCICFSFSIFNLSHVFLLSLPLFSHSVAHILHSCRVIFRLVVPFICPP